MSEEIKKHAGGRPRKELENIEFDGWDQLEALAMWSNCEYCAEQLSMSSDTLTERIKERYAMSFPEYKDKVQEKLRTNLRKKQYDTAMQGNATLLIWLGKNMLNQSDKQEQGINLSGEKLVIQIDK